VFWLHCQKKKNAGLEYCTGFSCYSTLRRWVYAKCRPGLKEKAIPLPTYNSKKQQANCDYQLFMGVGSRGRVGGPCSLPPPPPRVFIDGTNIVGRGLKVLFSAVLLLFGLFSVGPHWKWLNSAILRYFIANLRSFFRCPPPLWKNFCRRPWNLSWSTDDEAEALNTRPRAGTAPSVDAYGNNAQDLYAFKRNFS